MTHLAILLVSLFLGNILATPEDELRSGNRRFSDRLYKELLDTKPNENFVFCPFPVQTILASIALASENTNSRKIVQIRNAVNLPNTTKKMNEAFEAIIPHLNKIDDDFKLFQATKFYFQNGFNGQQWYRDNVSKVYHIEIENVNFQSRETVNKINEWVSEKTDNGITNFLNPEDIGKDTKQVIVSALYLLGKWEKPFDKSATVKKYFHGPNGNTYLVDMMVGKQSFEYLEDKDNQYLKMELLRDGGGAQVIFMLPKRNDFDVRLFGPFENKTTAEIKYKPTMVHVVIPKFTILSNLRLKPILQKLGVQELFNWDFNLEGLSRSNYELTKVNEMFQKSLIEVSEYGVKAAAVTDALIYVDASPDHKTFIADHPFMFQIVIDNMIVFTGRVVNP